MILAVCLGCHIAALSAQSRLSYVISVRIIKRSPAIFTPFRTLPPGNTLARAAAQEAAFDQLLTVDKCLGSTYGEIHGQFGSNCNSEPGELMLHKAARCSHISGYHCC